MKTIQTSLVFSLVLLLLGSLPVSAHFQMLYAPKAVFTDDDGNSVHLTLMFTHPFEGSVVMDMGKDEDGTLHPPLAFGMVHKGQKTDLLSQLIPITFGGLHTDGQGYEADIRLKGMGDFVFYLDPAPYYEPAEEKYIRHITKTIINRGAIPTDWDQLIGLPVEILPLDRPYALWVGNLFRGVVMVKQGDEMLPAANVAIEVEYLNHDVVDARFAEPAAIQAPHDNFVTQLIKTNQHGEFAFAFPKAGWWGFAALNAAGEQTYQGKALELGALIWVYVDAIE